MKTYTDTKQDTNGYVYVIKDETKGRKLGFSKNPDLRVKQLQTGNKEKLTIEYRLEVNNMSKAESSLHILFAAYRLRKGEWFHLEEKDLILLEKIFRARDITNTEYIQLITLGLR